MCFPSSTQEDEYANRALPSGINVHKKMLSVVVGPVQERSMPVERAKFGTPTEDLELLSDRLQARGVEAVVMESTGQYHKPVSLQWEGWVRLHRVTLLLQFFQATDSIQ